MNHPESRINQSLKLFPMMNFLHNGNGFILFNWTSMGLERKHTWNVMVVAVKCMRKRKEECWRKPQRPVWYLALIQICNPDFTILHGYLLEFGHFCHRSAHEICDGKNAYNINTLN